MKRFNPFGETNFTELQRNVIELISTISQNLKDSFSAWFSNVRKKGNERITLMFIPHSEKKIVNFHISVFTIAITASIFIAITVFTSLMILNHTSNVKEVDKLKIYGSEYKEQIIMYKQEVNSLYDVFQNLKPELEYLYSLTPENSGGAVWAKGGVSDPALGVQNDPNAPSVESLNFDEVDKDLKTTKDILRKVKTFMENRSKILESTPSLWPVNGYVISPFGKRASDFSGTQEFAQGIDIAAFPGSEIRATAPGTVSDISWDSYYGLRVKIVHKYGFITVYSHCQRVSVESEQKVSKGEIIGYVGKTGKTSRYVTHYQVMIGTQYVDPLPYLNKISLETKL